MLDFSVMLPIALEMFKIAARLQLKLLPLCFAAAAVNRDLNACQDTKV